MEARGEGGGERSGQGGKEGGGEGEMGKGKRRAHEPGGPLLGAAWSRKTNPGAHQGGLPGAETCQGTTTKTTAIGAGEGGASLKRQHLAGHQDEEAPAGGGGASL